MDSIVQRGLRIVRSYGREDCEKHSHNQSWPCSHGSDNSAASGFKAKGKLAVAAILFPWSLFMIPLYKLADIVVHAFNGGCIGH